MGMNPKSSSSSSGGDLQTRAEQDFQKCMTQAARQIRSLEKKIVELQDDRAHLQTEITDLRAALSACQQERDRLRNIDIQFTKAMTQAARQIRSLEKKVVELGEAQSTITTLRSQVAQKTEALRDYGRHRPSCGWNMRFDSEGEPVPQGDRCTCGLWQALTPPSEEA